jgi:hypothetical protein
MQPWLGIPWSRVGRRFNSIDNGDARRLGDCDDAVPRGFKASVKYLCRVGDSVHEPSALGGEIAILTCRRKTAKAATGFVAAFSILAIAGYSERTEPLARTDRRTERSRHDLSLDK